MIGDAAKNQLSTNPEITVFDAKLLIGREYMEKTVQDDIKLWLFKVKWKGVTVTWAVVDLRLFDFFIHGSGKRKTIWQIGQGKLNRGYMAKRSFDIF